MKLFDRMKRSLSRRRTDALALLKIDAVRILVCRVRKYYFMNIKKSLKLWQGGQEHLAANVHGRTTIEHNLEGLHDITGGRSLRIIRPLSVIESIKPLSEAAQKGKGHDINYVCDARVLAVGPRTEGEIFSLMAYGFHPKNIRGLDLISYSPFIDVGDMHDMKYENDSFDVVICSCVLVYSVAPKEACMEIIRVCKDGGLICISQDTVPETGSYHLEALGKQTISCQDYIDLFAGFVKRVIFKHEFPEELRPISPEAGEAANYTMGLIFQVNKS